MLALFLSMTVQAEIVNISTRGLAGSGDQTMIAGFAITGTESLKVAIIAGGPSLSDFGVSNVLADPKLSVFDAEGIKIGSNDSWGNNPEVAALAIAPRYDNEAALVMNLAPGKYTIHVEGAGEVSGNAIVAVEKLAQSSASFLSNISTRAKVGLGDDRMIVGFVLSDNQKLVMVAGGPSLADFGVTGVLADPVVSLYDSSGKQLSENDNWKSGNSSADITEITASSLSPKYDSESALISTLGAGSYTLVAGGGGTGNAIVGIEDYATSSDNTGPSFADNKYTSYWLKNISDMNDGIFANSDFLYQQTPDVASCNAGSLTAQARQRELDTLNKVRQLHLLASLEYDDSANEQVQQAALIQRANNYLSHTPAVTDACYSTTGYDGSNSSNLFLIGADSDPAVDMVSLIDDASNISTVSAVGHRRTLLNPFITANSYGQVAGGSAVKISHFSNSSLPIATEIPDFIAFPYLRYPYVFFSGEIGSTKTPWSLSIIEDKSSIWGNQHEYFAQATVTVKQKDNGQSLVVANVYKDTQGFGVPNVLSWTVNGWQYDTWYQVEVDNINYQSRASSRLVYDVYIDYKNFFNVSFPLESGDRKEGNNLYGSLADVDDKDSYELTLQGNTSFSGDSQFSNMAFFVAVYDENKKRLISKDSSFSIDLPLGTYTIIVSDCNEENFCYPQYKDYQVLIN